MWLLIRPNDYPADHLITQSHLPDHPTACTSSPHDGGNIGLVPEAWFANNSLEQKSGCIRVDNDNMDVAFAIAPDPAPLMSPVVSALT